MINAFVKGELTSKDGGPQSCSFSLQAPRAPGVVVQHPKVWAPKEATHAGALSILQDLTVGKEERKGGEERRRGEEESRNLIFVLKKKEKIVSERTVKLVKGRGRKREGEEESK